MEGFIISMLASFAASQVCVFVRWVLASARTQRKTRHAKHAKRKRV